MKKIKIAFVGLSHLGLNYLAASAKKNFNTIGYSNDKKLIKSLNKNIISITEPNLLETIKENKKKIQFTYNLEDLSNCNLVFLSQDTATDKHNNINLYELRRTLSKLTKSLHPNTKIIILSQVPPGFTSSIKWQKNILYYQVETLIFGESLKRALYPERIIVGCNDFSKKIDEDYLRYLKSFNCEIFKMNYQTAELAKISINMILVASLSTSNIISEICEKIGADWSKIIPILRTDKRIGKFSYIKPGLGISGGNLERDMKTLIYLSKKNKTDFSLIKNFIKNSEYQKKWVIRKLKSKILRNYTAPNITILGLTYKENTNSIKNSPSLFLINFLKKHKIRVFDPAVKKLIISKDLKYLKSLEEGLISCDILILMTPWKHFKSITFELLFKYMKNKDIIDPFNVLDLKKDQKLFFNYYVLGKG